MLYAYIILVLRVYAQWVYCVYVRIRLLALGVTSMHIFSHMPGHINLSYLTDKYLYTAIYK